MSSKYMKILIEAMLKSPEKNNLFILAWLKKIL